MVAAANTVGVDVFAFVVTGNAFTAAANGETAPRPMRRTRTSCAPTSDWLPHPDARADPDRRVDRHRHRRARANRLDAVATYFGLIEGATAGDERLAELATALTDKELRDCLTTEVKDGRMNGPSQPVGEAASRVGYPVIVDALRQAGARMAARHWAPFRTMAGIIAYHANNTVPAATVQVALNAALTDDLGYRMTFLALRGNQPRTAV